MWIHKKVSQIRCSIFGIIACTACCSPNRHRDKITILRPAGGPSPSFDQYETSILSRFFWSPKTAFFGPFLALIQSFFCHFCDTSRNWTFLLSEFPLIQTFWDRFYETLRLPRLTKSTRFLTVRTRHGPNLRVDFWGLRFSYAAATFFLTQFLMAHFENVKYVVIFDTPIFDHLPLVKKKYVFMTLFEARQGGVPQESQNWWWTFLVSQFFVTSENVKYLVIFCDNFLVIFDTPIFGHFPFKIK